MSRRVVSLILLCVASNLFAREISITILHTCDLHANVLPTENYNGLTNLGGIARCATAIREIRAQEPNVLLVDAGDTIQGAAIGYLTDGQVMVKALNHLRYDAWVWGNHEFDWGLDKLVACAQQAHMPILNANLHAATTNLGGTNTAARLVSLVRPDLLVTVDGIKVGIVGLNTPGIPNWSRPRLIEGLQFTDSIEELKTVVPALRREGAQVLVLVCHQGYREGGDDHANQINAIARSYPEFDVIIGAHTHRNFPEFKVSNVLYCQADYFGIHLGRVDLVFDTERNQVIRRSSKTLVMDDQVPLDAETVKLLSPEIDKSEKILAKVIGEATGEFGLQGAPKRETPVHDLVFEAIAHELRSRDVKLDAVVHGILDGRATLSKGPITVGEVWKLIPYENTIGVAHLTPRQLREILEEDAAAFDKREFRGVWGLKWAFDPEAEVGKRVVSLQHADGTPLGENEQLAVAFSSYDLASGGLRWNKLREIVDKPEVGLAEYDVETRQAVIDYIRKRGTIVPSVGNWWRVVRHKPEASAESQH